MKSGGKLLAVLHTKPEWKVAETSLSGPRLREDAKEERERLWRPLLGGEEPLPISAADRALHPRFPSARARASSSCPFSIRDCKKQEKGCVNDLD